MQMMTNDYVKTESHNHAEGVRNKTADLNNLGKQGFDWFYSKAKN